MQLQVHVQNPKPKPKKLTKQTLYYRINSADAAHRESACLRSCTEAEAIARQSRVSHTPYTEIISAREIIFSQI